MAITSLCAPGIAAHASAWSADQANPTAPTMTGTASNQQGTTIGHSDPDEIGTLTFVWNFTPAFLGERAPAMLAKHSFNRDEVTATVETHLNPADPNQWAQVIASTEPDIQLSSNFIVDADGYYEPTIASADGIGREEHERTLPAIAKINSVRLSAGNNTVDFAIFGDLIHGLGGWAGGGASVSASLDGITIATTGVSLDPVP
jgi:hypothetical protein